VISWFPLISCFEPLLLQILDYLRRYTEALTLATVAPPPGLLAGLAQAVKVAGVPTMHRVRGGGGGRKTLAGFQHR
jgi:hypothetical protein